jgi:hypothetical protein
MAKKFTNTHCVYCLRFFNKLTSDHVFPKSWYPDTTPLNLEKWQVPACSECNSKYSKMESELLQKVGLCLDPTELKSLGIAEKVIRSLNPENAKTATDGVHRQKQREKILKGLVPGHKISEEAIFPGFSPPPGMTINEQMAILVPEKQLKALGEKLVRGITYVKYKKCIDQNHKVNIFFAHEENAQLVVDEIRGFGQEYHCGPGVNIGVAFAQDDPHSGLFDIEIWGKLRMYSIVLPRKINI